MTILASAGTIQGQTGASCSSHILEWCLTVPVCNIQLLPWYPLPYCQETALVPISRALHSEEMFQDSPSIPPLPLMDHTSHMGKCGEKIPRNLVLLQTTGLAFQITASGSILDVLSVRKGGASFPAEKSPTCRRHPEPHHPCPWWEQAANTPLLTESGLDQRKAEIHGIAGGPWTSALLSSHSGAVGLPGTWKCGESSRLRGSDETPEAPQPWVGPGWKSVKLSHETSPLPPGSVWTGNTMRITLLLAFQQFCFRAWAKQGSAEAWEPRGDTNTWECRMNGSKSLHSTRCLHQGFSCQLNSSAWADTFRWRWLSVGQILLSLRQQSTPRNNSTFTAMRQEHFGVWRQEQDLGAF